MMIFGDPYRFAILIQNVPQWGNDNFRNGLFHYIVDGKMFPEEIRTATLNVDVGDLEDKKNDSMILFPENCKIFSQAKELAFKWLVEFIWPDFFDEKIDIPENFYQSYIYKASTTHLEDAGVLAFGVACGDQIRILAARVNVLVPETEEKFFWKTVDSIDVSEVIVNKEEMKKIINDAIDYYYSI